jgi:hypothetical protein
MEGAVFKCAMKSPKRRKESPERRESPEEESPSKNFEP